jgi:hypothetical protein
MERGDWLCKREKPAVPAILTAAANARTAVVWAVLMPLEIPLPVRRKPINGLRFVGRSEEGLKAKTPRISRINTDLTYFCVKASVCQYRSADGSANG